MIALGSTLDPAFKVAGCVVLVAAVGLTLLPSTFLRGLVQRVRGVVPVRRPGLGGMAGGGHDAAVKLIEHMYQPRRIESLAPTFDADGIKVYTISASGASVTRTHSRLSCRP